MITENPFGRIMVELKNGVLVDIRELPKEHYEYFLDMVIEIKHAYQIALLSKTERTQ